MEFIRNHWYDIGLIPMIISIVYLIMNWRSLSVLERLSLMNFAVIFWHQFEEYRFPGGEPAIINLATNASSDGPDDRYPLNQNNAMVINVVASYIVYFLPVLFPNVIWIGFMPVLFGISQFIIHGIVSPKQISNKIYTPGLCAVTFGHIPVGGYWLYYTISNRLLNGLNVLGGIIYLASFIGIFMLKIGYGVLKKADSKYPFQENEFERGGYAKKIRELNEKIK